MRILVVSATAMEAAPIIGRLERAVGSPDARTTHGRVAGHEIDVIVTGVGMVATSAWCAHALARTPYDIGLNFGVCGSFDPAFGPGAVVHVVSDRIAELGAEDGDAFITIEELGLLDDGRLVNTAPPSSAALSRLPSVSGITVNTVHGNEQSIADAVARFAPQVESMEGAAFMYACQMHQLRFAQVRAVSNVVETRNRSAWKMPQAIERLAQAALEILETV